MPANRFGRLCFAFVIVAALGVIGRNLYYRYLNESLYIAVMHSDVEAACLLLSRGASPDYLHSNEHGKKSTVFLQAMGNLAAESAKYTDALTIPNKETGGRAPAVSTLPPTRAEAIVCMLIQKGVNLRTSRAGQEGLTLACGMGSPSAVRCLLEAGVDPSKHADGRESALDAAFKYGEAYVPGSSSAVNVYARCISLAMLKLLREHGARLTLAQAVELEDKAEVQRFLNQNAALDVKDGYRALCVATRKNDLVTMRLLLERGVAPDPQSNASESAIDIAAGNGNLEIVKLLLQHDTNVNKRTAYSTALLTAARSGHAVILRLLLAQGADPELGTKFSTTVLSEAIRAAPDVVPNLLTRGADIHTLNELALRSAIANKRLDIVRELLRRGANVNPLLPPSTSGWMPGYNGDSPHYRLDPFSPLMIAVCYFPQCEALLLKAGATIGPDRETILAAAARSGHAELFARMLALGADINGVDSEGETALTRAIIHAPAGVRQLLQYGANPNCITHARETPLILAAQVGSIESVRLLLDVGAHVNTHPEHNHTALYWARKKNHPVVVTRLLHAGATE